MRGACAAGDPDQPGPGLAACADSGPMSRSPGLRLRNRSPWARLPPKVLLASRFFWCGRRTLARRENALRRVAETQARSSCDDLPATISCFLLRYPAAGSPFVVDETSAPPRAEAGDIERSFNVQIFCGISLPLRHPGTARRFSSGVRSALRFQPLLRSVRLYLYPSRLVWLWALHRARDMLAVSHICLFGVSTGFGFRALSSKQPYPVPRTVPGIAMTSEDIMPNNPKGERDPSSNEPDAPEGAQGKVLPALSPIKPSRIPASPDNDRPGEQLQPGPGAIPVDRLNASNDE